MYQADTFDVRGHTSVCYRLWYWTASWFSSAAYTGIYPRVSCCGYQEVSTSQHLWLGAVSSYHWLLWCLCVCDGRRDHTVTNLWPAVTTCSLSQANFRLFRWRLWLSMCTISWRCQFVMQYLVGLSVRQFFLRSCHAVWEQLVHCWCNHLNLSHFCHTHFATAVFSGRYFTVCAAPSPTFLIH